MIVKLFKPEFEKAIAEGRKTSTIRTIPRVRLPRIGELISLRVWTGKPYRSRQRVLRQGAITDVEWVQIGYVGIIHGVLDFDGLRVPAPDFLPDNKLQEYALADGFQSFAEMQDWFEHQHGLPFSGIRIAWTTSSALPEN